MYPTGGQPRQGYPMQYAGQNTQGQYAGQGNQRLYAPGPASSGPMMNRPGQGPGPASGPMMNRPGPGPGPMHNVQHGLLPTPLLQPTLVPVIAPMGQSSFLPAQPQPLFMPNPKALSPRRAPPADHQGQGMPQDNFQRGGGMQNNYTPSGNFSSPSPQNRVGSARFGPQGQGSTPSAPPPLFRPGPHSPSPKASNVESQKQLNKSEKEDLYRTFGVVLQEHGPIEVTDSRLLSVFMGLSPWMRQGIKYLGGLKDFFRQGAIFNVDGDVVSLAWQDEESEEKSNQGQASNPSPNATRVKSPIPVKAKSPLLTEKKSPVPAQHESSSLMGNQDGDAAEKPLSKITSQYRNAHSSTDGDSKDDGSWEGEEEEKGGWWLLDPLPGEDDSWKDMTPLQGKMGGGYYDDFKKIEEEDNKNPEEIQKKLVFTSTPSLDDKTEVDKTKAKSPRTDSPTPWNWEDSAIAQEAEAELKREAELAKAQQQSEQSVDGENWQEDTVSSSYAGSPSYAEASTKEIGAGYTSGDGGKVGEVQTSPKIINRTGSLHQAEGDVIVLEDDVNLEDVEEFSDKEEEAKEVEDAVVEVTDSAEDKSDVFTDALENGVEDDEEEDVGGKDGDVEGQSPTDNEIRVKAESAHGEEMKETGKSVDNAAFNGDTMSDMISKFINVAISAVTSEASEEDQSPKDNSALATSSKSPASSQGSPATSPNSQLDNLDSTNDSEIVGKESSISSVEMGLSPSVSSTEIGSSKSVRSIGVHTPKPQQVHKSMCTKEIKTRSCKVNTSSVHTHNKRIGTGEDPRIEQLTNDLAKEARKRRHINQDYDDLYDKYQMRKSEFASEKKELMCQLEQTSKELAECQHKLSGKGIASLNELRKTNVELKDAESRLNAAKLKIARAEKENSNLTKELEKTTRQLLDLEKSQARKADNRSRSTSMGGLELDPVKDPAVEEENKLLKMRSRSAEQKVLELQYQYAMQSLNKALQESQYIFRMYGNSLLSSSHRELLRMKWMDYQMYIKEKTDEVATSYYSALKALHQDVPLADIPSLKTQHVETFNPYKQSPVKAGEFGYISEAATGFVAPTQTLPDPSMPGMPPMEMGAAGMRMNPSVIPSANQVMDMGVAQTSQASTKAPPGLQGPSSQAPPGLSNIQVAGGNDLGMPFMQAQTQRSAPGKVSRRLPRKTPKAMLAANFMSTLQHTTKVYGSAAPSNNQPQVGMAMGGSGLGSGRQSPANVHDWLDNMDTDNAAPIQVMQAPNSSSLQQPPAPQVEPQVAPMETASTNPPQIEGMDTQMTGVQPAGVSDQMMVAPAGAMPTSRPAGIGRGRPRRVGVMPTPPPRFPSLEAQRGNVETMDVGMKPNANETLEATLRLSGTTTPVSVTSSSSSSRPASPFLATQMAGASEQSLRPSSPAGAVASAESQREDSGSITTRPRPSSAGDAMFESRMNAGAAEFNPLGKTRSQSVGRSDLIGTLESFDGPGTNEQQEVLQGNLDPASNLKDLSFKGDNMSNVAPRFRARQLRMPYHRGAEEEMMTTGASSESSSDRWTTKVSKKKRKALNLVEQQTQVIKEYRNLARSCDVKANEPSKGKDQTQKQGSLEKLFNYLQKQFKQLSRKEITDAILQVRLDHNGSLSGIAMGTIISEANGYLSRAEKKKSRQGSEVGMCAVCQDDLYGDPDERKLDCGHRFHSKCIKTWVSEEGTCPICRKHTLFPEDFPRLQ